MFPSCVSCCPPLLSPPEPLLGPTSILVVPEPRHSYLRGLMQPAFTPEAVSSALPRVERVLSGWMEVRAPMDRGVYRQLCWHDDRDVHAPHCAAGNCRGCRAQSM
jgi:hypothetical protein